MAKARSHERAAINALIEAVGARLMFLLLNSPDFNPTEKAFPAFSDAV